MPRGRKIPPAQRMEWLAAFERGKTIAEIAKDDGRSERTVSAQLARGRAEREQGEVRSGLLRDAYRQHNEDLAAVAERTVRRRSSGGPFSGLDRRAAMLLEGLKEHIPKSPLWKAARELEYHVRELDRHSTELKKGLELLVDEDDAIRTSNVALGDEVVRSLQYAARKTVDGDLEDLPYTRPVNDEGRNLQWGDFSLSKKVVDSAVDDELDELERKHRALVEHVRGLDRLELMSRTYERLQELGEVIDEEVDLLVLRRLLPGHCRLCPGMTSE